MPLNDENMLPKRVREMAQMADLLQAEQLMLDRLLAVIRELFAQGSVNNNTTLTKAELERICGLLTGCVCRVDEYAEELTIHICIKRNSGRPLSIRALIEGIKVLVPAHLKYVIVPELTAGVNIGAGRLKQRIRYTLCNELYSGELPNRVWLGGGRPEAIKIGLKTAGQRFSAPTPKGLGGGADNNGILPEVEAAAYVFNIEYCGEGFAGEE